MKLALIWSALAALSGGEGTPASSPYAEAFVRAPAEAPIIGDLSLVISLGVIVGEEFEDFNGVDLDSENVFYAGAALWVRVDDRWSIEFRLKYEEKTKLEDAGGVSQDEVDGIEANVNAVLRFPTPAGVVTPFVTAGAGLHRWDGEVLLDDETDPVYNAGGGVLIGIGSTVELLIEARYSYIDLDDADPLKRWQGGAGLAFTF